MVATEALDSAIAAHSAWKHRLAKAIATGTDVATPDKVRVDSACDLGRWPCGAGATVRSDPHHAGIKDLHAQLRRAASDVLAMALTGRKTDAEKAMGGGSVFTATSAKLTMAMVAWKQAGSC